MSEKWTSECTPVKQQHFRMLLQTHLRICKGIIKRHSWTARSYHYFDLNAGSGKSRKCWGSPITFANLAYDEGVQFRAWFFEKRKQEYSELRTHVTDFEDWHPCFSNEYDIQVIQGCHEQTLPCVLKQFTQEAVNIYGMVYSDPPGNSPPFCLIKNMIAVPCFKHLDVLIYLSATNLKRMRRSPTCRYESFLSDALQGLGKQHVIIREKQAQHQWTFALCTNWDAYPEFTNQGFHRIDTSRGKEIIRILNYTAEELEENPFDEDEDDD